MRDLKRFSAWTAALVIGALFVWAGPVSGQAGTPLGAQTLGRAYWHVFVAYAVVWLLVLGWLVSIVRRLRRVEERVGKE